MEPRARAKPSRALEGEVLETSHWEEARHWMSIYADLLEFKRGILDRVETHRYFATSQIMSHAWSDPALFPEEVRNYVRRVRKILADLAIPVDLVNKPGRGYSLVFRPT
jgi:hypothetical protein